MPSFVDVSALASSVTYENTWKTKTPVPFSGVDNAVAVTGKIYVMGISVNYEYNPETDNWTVKEPMPTPRWYFGIAVYENKVYTVGGLKPIGEDVYEATEMEVYDPSTNTWESKAPLPMSRSYEAVTSIVCGKIHLIGPESHDVYDVASDSWKNSTPMPTTDRNCKYCSMVDICLPKLGTKQADVDKYIAKYLGRE